MRDAWDFNEFFLACIQAMAPSGVTLGTCTQRVAKCNCYIPTLANSGVQAGTSTSHALTRMGTRVSFRANRPPAGCIAPVLMTNASVRDGLITDYRQQTPNVIIRLDTIGIPEPFFFWKSHRFESSALCTSCCYIKSQTAIQGRHR